jgi:hypothetical protein
MTKPAPTLVFKMYCTNKGFASEGLIFHLIFKATEKVLNLTQE